MNSTEHLVATLVTEIAAITRNDNDSLRYLIEQLRSHNLLEKVCEDAIEDEAERAERAETELGTVENQLSERDEEIAEMNSRLDQIITLCKSTKKVVEGEDDSGV